MLIYMEYFRKKKLPQFQENSFIMRYFYNYKIILVQYLKKHSDKLVYKVYIWVLFGIIFGIEKEALPY